jgi:peptidoglycan hydrolase-like protein with peptidoglycan-binding domain
MIKQVQTKLNVKADGIIGPETQKALKDFQSSKGLPANGQLDQQTLSALGVSGSAAGGASAKPEKKSEGSAAGGASASTEKKSEQAAQPKSEGKAEGSAAAGGSSGSAAGSPSSSSPASGSTTEQKPQQAPAPSTPKQGDKKY